MSVVTFIVKLMMHFTQKFLSSGSIQLWLALHGLGLMDGDADLVFDVESPFQLGGGYFYLSRDRWMASFRFMD
jgi:hypothetical protein